MFRPLLAEAANLKTLVYPVFASPKYDGFRCVIDGMAEPVSRNLKPIANVYTRGKLSELGLPKIDGELLTFTNDKVDDFDTVQSKLTTRAGMPDFRYMVFDQYMITAEPYIDRYAKLQTFFQHNKFKNVRLVEQKLIHNEEELLDYEAECLKQGWEGVMVRSLNGPYKMGRSTTKEGILLKLKRFFDAEAVIKEAYEFQHNANVLVAQELGFKRQTLKENMVGMDKLGGWTVKWGDVEFDIGVGLNENQRNEYWQGDRCVGRTIKFKYQSVGSSGKPRFPVFLGFRPDADMD
jgi:DNA ligase-1